MHNRSNEGAFGQDDTPDIKSKGTMIPAGSRILGFDGLKAIAIIGVTLFHMFPEAVRGGYLGVSLFLLLTGYLLAYTSAHSWQQNTYRTLSYFLKRIKRIYPALFIVVLSTIGIYHFLLPDSVSGIRAEVLSVFLGYNNWWQIHQNADYFTRLANASPFTHLWFMGIEMQYFIIWPILFLLYRLFYVKIGYKLALAFVASLAVASSILMPYLYVPGEDVTRMYYGTDTRIYAMLIGAFLGLLRANRSTYTVLSPLKKALGLFIFTGFILAVLAGYLLLDGQNPIVYQGGMLFATIGFAIMVLLTEHNGLPIGKLLETPVLRWIGHHSYSIFLWQYPVLYLFQRMHWEEAMGNPILYNVTILGTIVLLTIWTDEITALIGKISSISHFLHTSKKLFVIVTSVIGCLIMSVGVYGVITASNQKVNDVSALQSRLEANAALQQQENEKAAARLSEHRASVQKSLDGVACIGDSVMLGSSGPLRQVLPNAYIDAKVSRYVGAGLDIAKRMDQEGRLGKVVLIGLGTNGPISGYYEDETQALLRYLGPDREIFWVNIYGPHLSWEKTNNEYLEKLAKDHKNIHIIDWHGLVANHKEWLSGDGIHPNNQGIKEYAKLVHETMEKQLLEQEEGQ